MVLARLLTALGICLFSVPAATATTIAFDGTMIAFDSQTTEGNLKYFAPRLKVKRVGKHLVGTAGDVEAGMKFKDWFADQSKKFPDISELQILIIDPQGKPFTYGASGARIELPTPTSIGSGGDIALGAMHAGKTAKEAVEIASRCDLYTGGEVHVEKP